MNVVGRDKWQRLKRSGRYERQYHHRYLVSPAKASRWARHWCTTSMAIARSVTSSFGTALTATAAAATTSRKDRRSIPTYCLHCNGRPRRILLPGVFVYHLESEPAKIGQLERSRDETVAEILKSETRNNEKHPPRGSEPSVFGF